MKGPIRPNKNKFRNNTIVANDKDSALLKFSMTAGVADNVFEGNKLFGENANRGEVPRDSIEKLSTKPEIKLPEVGPNALRVVSEAVAALPKSKKHRRLLIGRSRSRTFVSEARTSRSLVTAETATVAPAR